MVECQLPKLNTRVRFPSSAPIESLGAPVAWGAFFFVSGFVVSGGDFYSTNLPGGAAIGCAVFAFQNGFFCKAIEKPVAK